MSWPVVELSSICERVSVGHVGTTSKFYTDNEGVPFLRTQNINSEGLVLNDLKFITRDFHTKLKKSTLADGDVVLSRVISTSINCGMVPKSLDGANCANIILVRPNKDSLDAKFFTYYLRSDIVQRKLLRRQVGSAQSVVNTGVLKAWPIPLIPLEEQKRIAAILDKADVIRRKRQKAIELADQFLRSAFLDMFGDPVTNPKDWPLVRLADATSKIGSGATPRGGKAAYVESGVSLVRSMNIHDDKFLYKDLAHISGDQADLLSNVTVEANDVLLNITGASVCRCAMVDPSILPARVNQHVCILRTNGEILKPSFLLHLIISASFRRDLLHTAGAGGATREALTKDQISNLQIALPPIDLQEKFCKLVAKVSKSKYDANLALKSARNFLDSASQQAFKGELTQSKPA